VIVGQVGNYKNVNSTPGMAPVKLFGPKQADGKKSFIAIVSKAGRGIVAIKNSASEKFGVLWTKEVS
jgi:hypothetical protein